MTTASRPIREPTRRNSLREAIRKIEIALPDPEHTLEQDQEWFVAEIDGEWQRLHVHDYPEIYGVQGLYEKLVYEILECNSPTVVRTLLAQEIEKADAPAEALRALDLGAGNGIVGEELVRRMGAQAVMGIDIFEEAAMATERDRPGLYDEYIVGDITNLDDEQRRRIEDFKPNCLTCVAALGFGDIPPEVFAAAYNFCAPGSWVAFTIKESFLDERGDQTGFSRFIHRMIEDGRLDCRVTKRYQHRLAMDRSPLHYVSIVGVKKGDVTPEMLE